MRILVSLLLLVCTSTCALAQTPADKTVKPVTTETPARTKTPSKTEMPSKGEMQSQMSAATNEIRKELADLEKQIASSNDEKEIKDLKEQADMLKKQLAMMEGLSKNMAHMSDKVYKEAAEQETAPTVPKRDIARINILPKKILTEAELALFIKKVHAGVEKLIPPVERVEALNIYNETNAQYKSSSIVANAATGCWMIGHWEKALYIMGRACLDDITDADNMNNYAAFLVMTGGEQAAVPILEYLNEEYPNNSTILNNLGQAWFGLGEMDKAKKYLDTATIIYPNHSTANSTLSGIAVANHDPQKAISYLKASLKESYDPDKEAALRKLGYEITYDDMPPFNYPMKDDALELIRFVNSWPENVQTNVDDDKPAVALQRYLKGLSNLTQALEDENKNLEKSIKEDAQKLANDSSYRSENLEPFNCPAYLQAGRSLLLIDAEESNSYSSLGIQLLFPFIKRSTGPNKATTPVSIRKMSLECRKIWHDSVLVPTSVLELEMKRNATNSSGDIDCHDADAKLNAFLAKRSAIYQRGVKLIKDKFTSKSKQFDQWLKLSLYGSLSRPPRSVDDLTYALIGAMEQTKGRRLFGNKTLGALALLFIEQGNLFEQKYRSACIDPPADSDPGADDLAPLMHKWVECKYIKKVKTPRVYTFTLNCNTMTEETDSKLKEKKSDVNKGSGASTSRRNTGKGPIQGHRGPNTSFDDLNEKEVVNPGPLTAEIKDISQFSLEYNKSGNLVGFNFQLNEDGTELKDPDSIESGIDSRWSWNAISSGKRGYLNKLLIK